MRKIFKAQKGKDFYRDQLEYMEYDPDMYQNSYDVYKDNICDEEIAYNISKKTGDE